MHDFKANTIGSTHILVKIFTKFYLSVLVCTMGSAVLVLGLYFLILCEYNKVLFNFLIQLIVTDCSLFLLCTLVSKHA